MCTGVSESFAGVKLSGLLGFRVLLELIGIEPQSDCESYNMLYCEVRVEWVFICIFV